MKDAGRVHHAVEPAEHARRVRHGALHRRRVGEIDRHRNAADALRRRPRGLGVAVQHRDPRALGREQCDSGAPNA